MAPSPPVPAFYKFILVSSQGMGRKAWWRSLQLMAALSLLPVWLYPVSPFKSQRESGIDVCLEASNFIFSQGYLFYLSQWMRVHNICGRRFIGVDWWLEHASMWIWVDCARSVVWGGQEWTGEGQSTFQPCLILIPGTWESSFTRCHIFCRSWNNSC